MSKKSNIIVSIVLIIIGILMYTLFNDYLKSIDVEMTDFFSGFILALGLGNLVRVLFTSKKF